MVTTNSSLPTKWWGRLPLSMEILGFNGLMFGHYGKKGKSKYFVALWGSKSSSILFCIFVAYRFLTPGFRTPWNMLRWKQQKFCNNKTTRGWKPVFCEDGLGELMQRHWPRTIDDLERIIQKTVLSRTARLRTPADDARACHVLQAQSQK